MLAKFYISPAINFLFWILTAHEQTKTDQIFADILDEQWTLFAANEHDCCKLHESNTQVLLDDGFKWKRIIF